MADALGVARSNLAKQADAAPRAERRGRKPQPDSELLAEIKELIAAMPTFGYRPGACADSPPPGPSRRPVGEREASLSRDEGAWAVAAAPYVSSG
ncbi:MAG: hypothetical protein JOY71_04450 [Acetobacteraceae bacterium]|nr:hypothetical protein [Acetobacteraceae bacterium]MBV8521370.1 hypothetical protein [Acetobacteraceae bacterium]